MKFQYKVISALFAVVICVLSLSLNVWADENGTTSVPNHDDGIVGPELPIQVKKSSDEWGFTILGSTVTITYSDFDTVYSGEMYVSTRSKNIYVYQFNPYTQEFYLSTAFCGAFKKLDMQRSNYRISFLGMNHGIYSMPNDYIISGSGSEQAALASLAQNAFGDFTTTVDYSLLDYNNLACQFIVNGASSEVWTRETSAYINGNVLRVPYTSGNFATECTGTTERGDVADCYFGLIEFTDIEAVNNFKINFRKTGDISDFFFCFNEAGECSGTIDTCRQFDSDKSSGGVLKVIETEHPVINVSINDNCNYNQYGIRVSSNSELLGKIENYIESCLPASRVEELKAQALAGGYQLYNAIITLASRGDVNGSVTEVCGSDVASYVAEFTKNLNARTFSVTKTLSGAEFLFTQKIQPYYSCRSVSFSLSDYLNVSANNVYKLELVDLTHNKVLDYTYISTGYSENKGSNPFGTYVEDYESPDDMSNGDSSGSRENDGFADNDPDNPFSSPDSIGGVDIPDIANGTSFSGWLLDSNVFSEALNLLSDSLSGVGKFYSIAYSVLPPVYVVVAFMGVAILVFLRILGR